jgi:hypothetical protein
MFSSTEGVGLVGRQKRDNQEAETRVGTTHDLCKLFIAASQISVRNFQGEATLKMLRLTDNCDKVR